MSAGSHDRDLFPKMLAEGLWALGNYYFNLYLVRGRGACALIEVGVSGVTDEVIRQLESLGVRPTFLVVTHPHSDHLTGLAGLTERFPDALVVAGEGAADFLGRPKAAEALINEDRHITEFLKAHGLPPGRPPVSEPPSLADCLIARDNDEMDLGDLTVRFLTAKGHSTGAVAVHVPEIEALILSDSLGFRFPGRGVFPLFFTNFAEYTATLDRFTHLDPAILGPAHQGPIVGKDEARKALGDSVAQALTLSERILSDVGPSEELAQQIFDECYVDELTMYTPENILNCVKLLMKRARE